MTQGHGRNPSRTPPETPKFDFEFDFVLAARKIFSGIYKHFVSWQAISLLRKLAMPMFTKATMATGMGHAFGIANASATSHRLEN